MFERYTELLRRTIFFARYEAGNLGASSIETEHLLLGLLRENRDFRNRLPGGSAEQIRKSIEERVPRPVQPLATSVDIPLTQDSRRALQYAADESDALQHSHIGCCHLLLGLLRVETSAAAVLLREFGITYASYRAEVAESEPVPPPARAPASPLAKAKVDLRRLLGSIMQLKDAGGQPLRTGWTRKEALGHLVDWAAAHQQWFARALTEPRLTAVGYPEDGWLSAQKYNDLPWETLVDLCYSLNHLMVHVIGCMPAEKMDTPCRIGIAEPIPLMELVHRYVAHCEDVVAQLQMRA